MKKTLFFLIILMVLPALVYAGFHLGMADAVKKKVKKLDEKVAEKQEESEEKAIKQLYATLESSMEREDGTAFGSCISNDYSHQQLTKSDWIDVVVDDLFVNNSNIQVSITNLSITVTGNSATASFHLKVTTAESGVVMDDPAGADPVGVFSYLIKENGSWKFYGDHTPPTYYVYGGSTPLTPPQVFDPGEHGYTLLSSAGTSETKIFHGSYDYYDVVVYFKNIVKVDALQKSDSSYYSTLEFDGNVTNVGNLLGAPDELYATVGTGEFFPDTHGCVLISSEGSSSIKVIVVP